MYSHCDSPFRCCRVEQSRDISGWYGKAFKNQRFDSLISHSRSLRPVRFMSGLRQALRSRLRCTSLPMTESFNLLDIHWLSFALSALATQPGTKAETFPPSLAISFTMRELRYVYSSLGIRNIVSTAGFRFRFINAI